jgi:hypothetical protein
MILIATGSTRPAAVDLSDKHVITLQEVLPLLVTFKEEGNHHPENSI